MFNFFRPFIFKFSPEVAHSLAIKALKLNNLVSSKPKDSKFLEIYSELYDRNMDELVNKYYSDLSIESNNSKQKLYIPIPFWFCKDYGSAFHLCIV